MSTRRKSIKLKSVIPTAKDTIKNRDLTPVNKTIYAKNAFSNRTISNCSFSHDNINKLFLKHSFLDNSTFNHTVLTDNITFHDSVLTRCKFNNSKFDNIPNKDFLLNSKFTNCEFICTCFNKIEIRGVIFINCKIDSIFTKCVISNSRYSNCNFSFKSIEELQINSGSTTFKNVVF